MGAWVFLGLVPFILLVRSYCKFVTPHKITESLVVPPELEKEMVNLTEFCPLEGFYLGQVWWNAQNTHFYNVSQGILCHFVVPQYNIHGNVLIGSSKVPPYETSPRECADSSYSVEMYFYHGSFGYFSFYEEQIGTFCNYDKTAYIVANGLGTYDINGPDLAEDTGSTEYRQSYWYGASAGVWVMYRGLVLRRSFILCKRYGRRCDQMGVELRRKEAVVFVHEQLRLTTHNATKLHRVVLLYLLIEGLMGDLFLLVANNGLLSKMQYVSLGYNLSGILLLGFETIESMHWLRERTRVFIKRLLFCYESSLLGEILGAALQQTFLTHINASRMFKSSNNINVAVSHYVWSIVGHGIFVFCVIGFIMLVRALWAIVYVWWKHQTMAIFSASCCVDTALGRRNKMTMLGGYHWVDDQLYYGPEALKSFGLLRVEEEDGAELIALRKLHWFAVPRHGMFVIGEVYGECVRPCALRPCTGIVSFFNQRLGGESDEETTRQGRRLVRVRSKIAPGPDTINIFPPS
ncbi:hypothetical protein PHYSODRAFT_523373 [Phytophthora sojae]|uniref:Uncharacterized protein n=1 Tax=Phytophthora sojae (strain P6497) TaxID=1094619 RepID=G5A532_PHYSP|nr:hypothetical protein PHYSODRAFT_523373 [Phytophthora sojae]EGZ09781.1 hypothetical protein PHYSODRAFT_523373 [Phytophthora sojae]|eukprot:XP_009534642.1 hypothetical protein PHYSODRAFT_523373 [Phytophthora sojae]